MKIYKIEFTAIITMHFIALTLSEDFEILRVRAVGGWKKGTDTFKIPSSLCNQQESDYINCARFSAKAKSVSGQRCLCSCANEKSTLMFHNNVWRCKKNWGVRTLLGFKWSTYTRFYKEWGRNELRMLNVSDPDRKLSLSWNHPQCVVDKESSSYIACNGSEVPFRSDLFTIQKTDEDNPFDLKVNGSVTGAELLRGRIIKLGIRCSSSTLIFKTLIFKYEGKLTCPISTPTAQPSVTTNPLNEASTLSPSTITRTTSYVRNTGTNGSPSISVIIPTASGIPGTNSVSSTTVSKTSSTGPQMSPTILVTTKTVPDVRSTVLYTSQFVSVSPTTISDVSPTVDIPPTISEVRPTASDTPSTISEVRPTASDTPSNISEIRSIASDTPPSTPDTTTSSSSENPARASPGNERRTDENSSSLALIAGTSAAVLAIVFIVGFLVCRRRYCKQNPYSNTKCESKKETVMMSSHTSSAYEPDDENAYKELDFREPPIYASHYQVPNRSSESHLTASDPNTDHVYAPLNISEGQNIYGPVNTQEPVYRVLESPANDNDIKSQIYGHSIGIEQPVYYMEELTVEGAEGPVQDGAIDNQPVYNVLEGPYHEGQEGSDHYGAISPEEPVYNTLEESYAERSVNDSEFINEPIYNVLEEGPNPEV